MKRFFIAIVVLSSAYAVIHSFIFSSDIANADECFIKCSGSVTFYKSQNVSESLDDLLFTIPESYYVKILTETDYAIDQHAKLNDNVFYCEYAGVRGCVLKSALLGEDYLKSVADPYYVTKIYTSENALFRPLLSTSVLDTYIPLNSSLEFISYLKTSEDTFYYVLYIEDGQERFGYVSASSTTDQTIADTIPKHRNSRAAETFAIVSGDEKEEFSQNVSLKNVLITLAIVIPVLAFIFLFFFSSNTEKAHKRG